jgi:hypothetical protein
MLLFKTTILEFIDELIVLFENKDKVVYKRLIQYHNIVKNQLDEYVLQTSAIKFLSDDKVHELIKMRNHRFLKGTQMEIDVDLLMDSCTSTNKAIIWKWVDAIMESIYI